MIRTLSLAAAVTLAGALAACASPEPEPEPTDDTASSWCEVPSGASSDAITASGDFGESVALAFEPGLEVAALERTVLDSGDGEVVEEDDWAAIAFALYSARTGDELQAAGFGEANDEALWMNRERIAPWMLETVGCVEAGSRIVSVIPGGDVFGAEGYEGEDFSVAGDEPVVLVVDVIRKLDRAWGEDRVVAGSLPHVELAAGGAPSIAIPSSEPSGELELGVLKLGDGPVVPAESQVLVQYHGVSWETGETFDSSWERGTPAVFPLSGVVPGFSAAIAGQTVGSQVIVVIPPELGYGVDSSQHELGGQTLVFVVDILSFV